MAADTVDAVLDELGRRSRCRTKRLRLLGADGFREPPPGSAGGTSRQPLRHAGRRRRGARRRRPDARRAARSPGLPYLRAEAVYAARHEMAPTLDDVLSRRTRARLFDRDAAVAAAPAVAALLAAELGWDDDEVARQIDDFVARCAAEQRGRSARRRSTCSARGTDPMGSAVAPDRAARPRRPPARSAPSTCRPPCSTDSPPSPRPPPTDDATAEASRDWWPLAMHWALAGQVARRAAAVCRPSTAEQVSGLVRTCDAARVPVTAAGGRSGVCGAIVPVFGGVVLDLTGAGRHRRRRRRVGHRRGARRHVRPRPRGRARRTPRPQRRPLAAELRHRDRRRLGGLPRRRPVQHPLRQDRRHGRRPRGGARRRLGRPHRGSPRRRPPAPTSTGCSSAPRARSASSPGSGCAPTRSRRPSAAPRTRSPRSPPGSTPAGASCAAAPRRPCCACTTRSSRNAATTATAPSTCCSCSTRATRRSSTPPWPSSPRSAPPPPARRRAGRAGGCTTATTRRALQALTHKGFVVDTMEIAAPWSGCRRSSTRPAPRCSPCRTPAPPAATSRTATPTAPACTSRSPATPPPDERRGDLRRRCGTPASAPCSPRAATCRHHHGVGPQPRAVRGRGARRRLAVLQAVKDALDPHGILNPGKLGLRHPFGAVAWP